MPEIRAERSVEVNAKPEEIWKLMADIDRWVEWKTFLAGSKAISGQPLEVGSRLKFKPKIGPAPVWLTVKIVESKYPNKFAWGGGGPGVKAVHGFEFKDIGGGKTKVTSSEVFEGPGVHFLKLILSQKTLEKLHEDWLAAVKAKFESRAR